MALRILSAILAGGKSRRFGSKAAAMLGELSLMDHTIQSLEEQTDGLVICGRTWPGIMSLVDRPAPDLGPLGGLNAALHHAQTVGFDAVLCVPVDVHLLPGNLRELLEGSEPKVFQIQHAVGLWPTRYASDLDRHVADGNSSFRGWIRSSGATLVADHLLELANLNTLDDLQELMRRDST